MRKFVIVLLIFVRHLAAKDRSFTSGSSFFVFSDKKTTFRVANYICKTEELVLASDVVQTKPKVVRDVVKRNNQMGRCYNLGIQRTVRDTSINSGKEFNFNELGFEKHKHVGEEFDDSKCFCLVLKADHKVVLRASNCSDDNYYLCYFQGCPIANLPRHDAGSVQVRYVTLENNATGRTALYTCLNPDDAVFSGFNFRYVRKVTKKCLNGKWENTPIPNCVGLVFGISPFQFSVVYLSTVLLFTFVILRVYSWRKKTARERKKKRASNPKRTAPPSTLSHDPTSRRYTASSIYASIWKLFSVFSSSTIHTDNELSDEEELEENEKVQFNYRRGDFSGSSQQSKDANEESYGQYQNRINYYQRRY